MDENLILPYSPTSCRTVHVYCMEVRRSVYYHPLYAQDKLVKVEIVRFVKVSENTGWNLCVREGL